MNGLVAGSSLSAIGIVIWVLWAWVNGADFDVIGIDADEVGSLLEFLWQAFLVSGPAATVLVGIVNVNAGKSFFTGSEPNP